MLAGVAASGLHGGIWCGVVNLQMLKKESTRSSGQRLQGAEVKVAWGARKGAAVREDSAELSEGRMTLW